MQRIPFPDFKALPEKIRRMLDGTPLNVVRIGAHASPSLFEAQGMLGYAIADPAVLDPRLRETAILRVACLSNSEYELHHHLPLARSAGLAEQDLQCITSGEYDGLERGLAAVCRFSDEVVTGLAPSDATLEALRGIFSDRITINLVLTIGCYMSIARLIAVTGIDLDEGALDHLPSGLGDGAGQAG